MNHLLLELLQLSLILVRFFLSITNMKRVCLSEINTIIRLSRLIKEKLIIFH